MLICIKYHYVNQERKGKINTITKVYAFIIMMPSDWMKNIKLIMDIAMLHMSCANPPKTSSGFSGVKCRLCSGNFVASDCDLHLIGKGDGPMARSLLHGRVHAVHNCDNCRSQTGDQPGCPPT